MVRSNVQNLADRFFSKFETRARRKEKDAFLACAKEGFRELGYTDAEMSIQQSGLGGKNLIIGAPDADVLFTAHYDTPGRNGWLMMPCVKTVGMSLAALVGLFLFVVLAVPGILLNIFGTDIAHYATLDLLLRLFPIVIFFGILFIKNPHNHNDNTSGCIGVYNVATIIAENPTLRERCAFVLFDMEEQGLLGSGAFAKWRSKTYPGKEQSYVINLDCIGVGEHLILASTKKPIAEAERAKMAQFLQGEGFDTIEKTSSLLGYLSDHAKFDRGVMLAFLRRAKLGGLYIPNIHTGRDRECDLEQIERLSASVVKYVSEVCVGNPAGNPV